MKESLIKFHPSVVIVQKKDSNDLMMGSYDDTYPLVAYRNLPNLLGGNPSMSDNNPFEVLKREIVEEFDDSVAGSNGYASKEDITLIRKGLLSAMTPFRDFYFEVQDIEGGRKAYNALASAFYSQIEQDVFEIARKNIENKNKLTTEGKVKIYNLEDLANGDRFSTAHLTGPILREFFKVDVAFPEQMSYTVLDSPRDSFAEYSKEFNYADSWRKH